MYKGYYNYSERNMFLNQLGFADYKTYLESDLWKTIKTKAFETNGYDCKLCNKSADVIHHRNYTLDTLKGQTFDWLVPLCHDCHRGIEFTKDNQKRSMPEHVDREFLKRLKAKQNVSVLHDIKRISKSALKQQKRRDKKREKELKLQNMRIGNYLRSKYPDQFRKLLDEMLESKNYERKAIQSFTQRN